MKALVLERKGELSIRDVELPRTVGPADVKIAVERVGVCGSDVHYFTHGRIGPYVVERPMVMGHEASGRVVQVGREVKGLAVGDRVCMEPGIPDLTSRASRLGLYNVDPGVVFWATPPVHGCLASEVVHPAAFTYRLPEGLSFGVGAMVEPFAIGVQAAVKGRLQPGDVAVVTGCGTIGVVTALAALAGGCSRVIISDVLQEKLDVAGRYPGITPVNVKRRDLATAVEEATGGWGADVVFEASGSPAVFPGLAALLRPGGTLVLVGIPVDPVPFDVAAAQAREATIETVFRYANVYPRAIALLSSGKVDLEPLISAVFPFEDGPAAFRRAAEGRGGDVKIQIQVAPMGGR